MPLPPLPHSLLPLRAACSAALLVTFDVLEKNGHQRRQHNDAQHQGSIHECSHGGKRALHGHGQMQLPTGAAEAQRGASCAGTHGCFASRGGGGSRRGRGGCRSGCQRTGTPSPIPSSTCGTHGCVCCVGVWEGPLFPCGFSPRAAGVSRGGDNHSAPRRSDHTTASPCQQHTSAQHWARTRHRGNTTRSHTRSAL